MPCLPLINLVQSTHTTLLQLAVLEIAPWQVGIQSAPQRRMRLTLDV